MTTSEEPLFTLPVLHIHPPGDSITHILVDDDCPCRPERQVEDGCVLYIHRAIDGRD